MRSQVMSSPSNSKIAAMRRAELATRRGHAEELAEVGAEEIELHDDRVVGVAEGVDLVALVGKGGAARAVVPHHLVGAVEHLSRGDELVTRMREGRQRRVEVEPVLAVHVLTDDRVAPFSLPRVHDARGYDRDRRCVTSRRRRTAAVYVRQNGVAGDTEASGARRGAVARGQRPRHGAL